MNSKMARELYLVLPRGSARITMQASRRSSAAISGRSASTSRTALVRRASRVPGRPSLKESWTLADQAVGFIYPRRIFTAAWPIDPFPPSPITEVMSRGIDSERIKSPASDGRLPIGRSCRRCQLRPRLLLRILEHPNDSEMIVYSD
jgi:hypothetical protein